VWGAYQWGATETGGQEPAPFYTILDPQCRSVEEYVCIIWKNPYWVIYVRWNLSVAIMLSTDLHAKLTVEENS
jgi:hypothetical protein